MQLVQLHVLVVLCAFVACTSCKYYLYVRVVYTKCMYYLYILVICVCTSYMCMYCSYMQYLCVLVVCTNFMY